MDGAAPKAKQKIVNAVDLFCGAGGTSTGLIYAVNELGYEIKLTAINHWDVAIATHTKNHEDVEHYCQSIDTIDPSKIVPGGRLQLLVASPECTHHSNARGGKPRSDQKRADAWLLMRWIEKLYVENILIENVKEFESWGPLTAKGLPDKRHKGQYFQQFIAALRINYNVEYRVLNCADYGDPTTRERLFILARRGHKRIVWPTRTHASRKELATRALQPDMFDTATGLKPWVAAREIIDWSLEGKSIFGRKKPLSPNTMRRIFKGLEKHGLKNFLVNNKGTQRNDRSVDDPTFTQAAGGNHQAIVEPFIIPAAHGKELRTHSVDDPLRTVVGSNMFGVVEPFIVPQHTSPDTRDIDEPVPTLTTTSRGVGVVEVKPFMLTGGREQTNRSAPRPVEDPVATITGTPNIGIVEGNAFLLGQQSDAALRSVHEPVPTVAAAGAIGKVDVEPFIVNMKGRSNARDVNEPTFTQTSGSPHQYLAEPYIIKFYGNGDGAESVNDPLSTVTGKDRFALCIPTLGIALDIRFRMLQPHELAAAMSFPEQYEFTGNRENKVKQIGNAVPRKTATALCTALLK